MWDEQDGHMTVKVLAKWWPTLQAAPDHRLPAVWRKDYVLRELDMEQVGTARTGWHGLSW